MGNDKVPYIVIGHDPYGNQTITVSELDRSQIGALLGTPGFTPGSQAAAGQ